MADREDSRRVMLEANPTPQARAIDAWVAADLARRYEAALAEPLPADLLALLRE